MPGRSILLITSAANARSAAVPSGATPKRSRGAARTSPAPLNSSAPWNTSAVAIAHAGRWRDWLLEKGRGPSTVNCAIVDFSGWFRWLIGEGMATQNPFAKVNRAVVESDGKQKRAQLPFHEPAEFWRVMDGLPHDFARSVVGNQALPHHEGDGRSQPPSSQRS